MKSSNFVKNIISKDKNIFNDAIYELINSKDTLNFEKLDESSDFIFPFLKEKISKEFVKLINKNHLDNIFKLMKYYSFDFEDMIVNSLLKFADDDITDILLEKLEFGSNEEKTYAAKYFTKIKDTLSIPLLKRVALCDFYYLKMNAAYALRGFRDTEILNKSKEIVKNSKDEFEKLSAFEFIIFWGNEIPFVLENAFNSQFRETIITNLLNENDFNTIKNEAEKHIKRIFQILIEGYPESINLNTLKYYEIIKYVKYLSDDNSNFAKGLLLYAKAKFKEFLENDNYIYDLDKENKDELKNISDMLKNIDIKDFEIEFDEQKPYEFENALNVISQYKNPDKENKLIEIINKGSLIETYTVQALEILHKKNLINSVNKEIVQNIKNTTLKTVAESFFTEKN